MCLSAFFQCFPRSVSMGLPWEPCSAPARKQAFSSTAHAPWWGMAYSVWNDLCKNYTYLPVKFQVAHEIFKVLTRTKKMFNYV